MLEKINKAFLFALEAHAGQSRKDGKPYIAHPFSVAQILSSDGADDDLVCAGLLHDVIEDAHVKPERIKEEFGDEVLRLVMFDTEDKSKSWEERKKQTIEELKHCDKKCAMLICADKLANINDTKQVLDDFGEDAWKYFKFGREVQEWLYRGYLDALKQLSDLKMYKELKENVELVFSRRNNYENKC